MIIETKQALYELEFKTIQVEVTGRCNLKCAHCRASYEPSAHVSIALVEKLFAFAKIKSGFNFTVSGGEPFLYPDLIPLLAMVRKREPNEVVITTNGFYIKNEITDEIEDLNFNKVTFQISIDSSEPSIYNDFRGKQNSFENALKNVMKLSILGMFTSIRATLTPQTLHQMEDILKLAVKYGAKRISFGTVVPSGSAVSNNNLLVSNFEKNNI